VSHRLEVSGVARVACVLLRVSALALTACGGGGDDEAKARQTIRDFVTATNERDGNRLCGKLLTQEYMEKATGAPAGQAEEACKQQLDLLKGLRLELISIGRTTVDGDEATVRAVIVASGTRSTRVFNLAKEDGSWKLQSGESARQ
jgi:hypothetical protein